MHHTIGRTMAAFAIAAALALPHALSAQAQEDAVVATVNGDPVTEGDIALAESELDAQFDRLPPAQKRAAALSALIEIKLAASASEKAGVADEAGFQRRMDFLRERALHSEFVRREVAPAVTDEAVRAWYDEQIAAAPASNEVRASHILIQVGQDAPEEEQQAAKAQADEIISELDGGADFAELAREHSDDGSAQNGGDLGYFGPGRMVPEFEQASFALEVGQHSAEPVRSQFGYHIIKVVDKRPQQPPAFEQVQQQVRSRLLSETYFAEVSTLREGAQIEISDPALKAAVEAIDGPGR
ncbi:MAG: peptidylprolyl isomerase [Rhizobiaceae bacterium]|nr:peptidylprolyl isomerase [Rhizobiaceae bacterium]